MATRVFNKPPPKSTIQAPKSRDEWTLLMRQVIAKAETQNDRRLPGLRKALVDGKAETHLRMLGIIHEGDIHREFPNKDS